jgi:hypothetical protein
MCAVQHKAINMSTRRTLNSIVALVDLFGSAVAVSRSIEGRKRPAAADLRRLGIEPDQFYGIGR